MGFTRTIRRNRGWIGAALIVALGGGIWLMTSRSSGADEASTTTYTTSAATTGTVTATVSGTGNLELADETEVWPEVGGTVASMEVKTGEAVKAGDVLFVLDDDEVESSITKAYASYQQSKSGVAQASSQLAKASNALDALETRADNASMTASVTDADVDAAEADVAAARASLSSAKASRDSALREYEEAVAARDDLEVVAPVSGTVWSLDVEEGDSVSASAGSGSSSASGSSASAIAAAASGSSSSSSGSASGSSAPVTIVPRKPLVARLAVNEVDLSALKIGQRAEFEFDALPDLTVTGKVTEIASEGTVDQGVVTFDVLVALDVTNKQLRPGMSAAATIVTAVARKCLLVPNAAVKADDDGNYVQVLASGSKTPRRVDVVTGLSGATQTQITSGLTAGQNVVTAETDTSDDDQRGGMMMMPGGPGR